jgi:hypothetical protein
MGIELSKLGLVIGPSHCSQFERSGRPARTADRGGKRDDHSNEVR